MSPFIIYDNNTICESHVDSAGPRPRKRARIDSEDEGEYPIVRPTPIFEVLRDKDYYFSAIQGVIVQVQSTLFRIPESMLSDCSPVLQDLLSKRHEDVGKTDSNPFFLYTTEDKFHALLWALVDDGLSNPVECIDRLISVASISEQYKCSHLKSRSLTLIRMLVPSHPPTSLTPYQLVSVLDIAHETHEPILAATVVALWTSHIQSSDSDPVPAILISDKYRLPDLRGVACYSYLKRFDSGEGKTVTAEGATHFRFDERLSTHQVIMLLAGYWSLVSVWERLRRDPPSGCEEMMNSKPVLEKSSVDVLGRLEAAIELTEKGSKQAVLLQKKLKELEESLKDHFEGCI